ncbi:unnamed protein product [Pipistrellus nathusii]|uniref:Uncharacterized protein n=1 Tax=Pipistrellus nathusii TaxID=59473 RepID=A0ABP0AAS0_PIPNA
MNSFHYVRIVATTSLPSPLAVTMREYKVLGTLPLLNFLIGHQENLRNSCEVCLIRDVHVQYKKNLNHDTRGSFSFSSQLCSRFEKTHHKCFSIFCIKVSFERGDAACVWCFWCLQFCLLRIWLKGYFSTEHEGKIILYACCDCLARTWPRMRA